MHLQIGDDLRTVHNAQLVYSNRQDIALTLLTGFKIWLVHNCQTEEDHLNIKIVTALLLYNACTLLNMMEICVTNNNKLKIHPRGMATFKKNEGKKREGKKQINKYINKERKKERKKKDRRKKTEEKKE